MLRFETKFFNDKQALANHRQDLVMWRKTTRALTFCLTVKSLVF